MMALGESFVEHRSLAKVSQLGWLGMPTKGMPLQFVKLGMDLIVVQDGSWMNMMSKLSLTSSMVLMRKLFFQTFWENIFKSFKIILQCYSQLNKLSSFSYPEFWHISLHTTPCWINVSRRNNCMSLPDVHLCNWDIWTNEGMAHPSLSLT